MLISKKIIILLFIVVPIVCMGQRFSLIAEAGGMKAQVDGDKVQGFHYNGFVVGIGTHYAFTPQHFLTVKTSLYNQGSRRKDKFARRPREGFQMEMDFNSIGLELSYKFAPVGRPYFLGAGFVRHQLVGLNYEIIDNVIVPEEKFVLDPDRISSSYNSIKFYYGFDIFKRAGLYLAFESAITDMLKTDFEEIRTLTPYSLSAVFTYEIIAPKIDEKKKRPGSKSRAGRMN